jgi:hypothetical protein
MSKILKTLNADFSQHTNGRKSIEVKFKKSDFVSRDKIIDYTNNRMCPIAYAMQRKFRKPFYILSDRIMDVAMSETHGEYPSKGAYHIEEVFCGSKCIEYDAFGFNSFGLIKHYYETTPWWKRIFFRAPSITIKRA